MYFGSMMTLSSPLLLCVASSLPAIVAFVGSSGGIRSSSGSSNIRQNLLRRANGLGFSSDLTASSRRNRNRSLYAIPVSDEKVGELSDEEMMGSRTGFIGLGIMGQGMAGNLLSTGRDLVVWNRTRSRAEALQKRFPDQVEIADSVQDLVSKSDVIYSMLDTPSAASEVFYGDKGLVEGLIAHMEGGGDDEEDDGRVDPKMIVDCATLTVEDMFIMSEESQKYGAQFLEAPVSGSKVPAETGQLIFLCAGDEEVYDHVQEDLSLMGKASFFLGTVGRGTEMKLVANMIMGSMMASLAEGMNLAEGVGLSTDQLIQILGLGAMANPMFALKGPKMHKDKKDYATNFPLKHQQKDMRFAVSLGDQVGQALPIASAAKAEYNRCKEAYGDSDFSAVIESFRTKPKQ